MIQEWGPRTKREWARIMAVLDRAHEEIADGSPDPRSTVKLLQLAHLSRAAACGTHLHKLDEPGFLSREKVRDDALLQLIGMFQHLESIAPTEGAGFDFRSLLR